MSALAERGATLIGGTLRKAEPLGGGSLSDIILISLEDGREAIVKTGPAPHTEAAMLEAIAETGAPAPAVLGVDDEALVIELLAAKGSLRNAWAGLGSALATLHRTRGRHYGWPQDYAFGAVTLHNEPADRWPAFWAEHRLIPQVRHIPPPLAKRLETLVADLPNRLPERPAPALLHGDLWGGNVLVNGRKISGLIDPACYYGHVEVDLAMLSLFDMPGPEFYDAYAPIEPGYDDRQPIYKLWPALVHLRLFGGGYRSMVEGFLSAAGV